MELNKLRIFDVVLGLFFSECILWSGKANSNGRLQQKRRKDRTPILLPGRRASCSYTAQDV